MWIAFLIAQRRACARLLLPVMQVIHCRTCGIQSTKPTDTPQPLYTLRDDTVIPQPRLGLGIRPHLPLHLSVDGPHPTIALELVALVFPKLCTRAHNRSNPPWIEPGIQAAGQVVWSTKGRRISTIYRPCERAS